MNTGDAVYRRRVSRVKCQMKEQSAPSPSVNRIETELSASGESDNDNSSLMEDFQLTMLIRTRTTTTVLVVPCRLITSIQQLFTGSSLCVEWTPYHFRLHRRLCVCVFLFCSIDREMLPLLVQVCSP
jgi:hypothetical protein